MEYLFRPLTQDTVDKEIDASSRLGSLWGGGLSCRARPFRFTSNRFGTVCNIETVVALSTTRSVDRVCIRPPSLRFFDWISILRSFRRS